MKKLFTLLALLISLTTFANTVIVKGYVRDANNKGVPNRYVKIYTDSSANTNCLIGHYKITNGEGFYIDTVNCTGTDIKKLLVSTESCSTVITNALQIIGSVAESNFTICLPPPVVVMPPVVTPPPPAPPVTCTAYFLFAPQISGVKFTSNVSINSPNDTIINRKWEFGDGETNSNSVDPTHTYAKLGIYNTCLTIKTAKGCESKICKTVVLGDSLSPIAGSVSEPIKIVRVYPNPVHLKMNALLWCLNNNVAAEISIVDIYGQKKWSSKINLVQGNNSIEVNTSFLTNGSYFFKVSTGFGIVSRKFYKL